ncbi:MAG: hypothetical protein M3Q07_25475 [Pseudobdellovibrionaceae bacterium]|nr:hypothetical protein [Pseudobdellovibrionaceae bacterium]
MNETEMIKLRERVRQELQEWHNPKVGNTFEKIHAGTGLATSTLRKISSGDAQNFEFTTCYRLLRAICPDTIFNVIDEVLGDNNVRTLSATKPSALRIEGREDAWLVVKLSTEEAMPVNFVSSHLGANYNTVIEKFLSTGYVSIDKGVIRASNTHNELLDEGSIRNLGHFFLDSTYTTKGSDVLVSRAFRTTPEKAEQARLLVKQTNTDLHKIFGEETKAQYDRQKEFVDFAFVLACTTF